MRGLDKMELDLEVVDRLLIELEFFVWWFFSFKFWKMLLEIKFREGVFVISCEFFGKESILIKIFVIIFYRIEFYVKLGRFIVFVFGLEIYDFSFLFMYRFEREDVDDIKVYLFYEISIC